MAKYIEITLKVPVKDLKELATVAGFQIPKNFVELYSTPVMKEVLAKFILNDWQMMNEDDAQDGYKEFFNDLMETE